MDIRKSSPLSSLVAAAVMALTLAIPDAHAADKPVRRVGASVAGLGIGDISDAMNPANPFNGGVEPIALPGDSRLVVFTYNRDQIFRVLSAPLKMTTIEFPEDEQIVGEPAWGESVRWDYETDGLNHLYVKPQAAGLVNTLSVNTNKRSYEFTLVSSPLGGIFYQKVRFRIPTTFAAKAKARSDARGERGEGRADLEGVRNPDALAVGPEQLNFEYSISGSASFKPEAAFDDGKAVWLRIPKGADWPVPLAKDGSDYVVVNFIRRGDFLVVQRLAEAIALRSGSEEVKVERGRRRILGLF
ncbi:MULTISPECIES: TrbG/VirB9 family P-type conjugative transfer protein [Cupriavidus]|jgi:type IV secretion system protein VirB9|uniref:TrbG/VirB9 family P-type conjugative transfer protein n=1 Tax=Cupriavidus basilensis TaxID=68895 RepID=A0A643FU97_9BURK|nr:MULTISPECIES: TrbG/VirB9 family P-type conjugative transfer protein [Cupriavidus]KUE86431.1 conjugal transfer protein TrbG [Cupriavidus necator]QOT81704.1 TrbG/VirB9 family P-type conjugative transfer protein [Cupriavidus basilensis]BDB30078.1 TrbG/VirB9 family P-type conjugative transfer protein [Cupriavidus sp. P-10]